ncbi:MAG: hypothetical protein V1857_00170 [archaeon]
MILITTSKEPTQRINSFVRDLNHSIPNTRTLRRGKTSTREMPKQVSAEQCDRLIVVHRWHGGPGRLEFYKLNEKGLVTHYPIILLRGVKLRREYGVKGRFTAQGITCENNQTIFRLGAALSEFLDLPQTKEHNFEVSLHMSCSNDDTIRISIADPNNGAEFGPSMSVDRLIWPDKAATS